MPRRRRAAAATATVGAAVIAAIPLTLHFEGNDASAEPFIFILPIVALVSLSGALWALRVRATKLFALNLAMVAIDAVAWLSLVMYEGG